jgi:uncharacterized protein (DUF1810 family)
LCRELRQSIVGDGRQCRAGVAAETAMITAASDPFALGRFVAAQDSVAATVTAELQAGRKQSHWMWFVFPQLAGLGHSAMARRYAISGRDEAEAYLAHPLLGARLRAWTALVLAAPSDDIGRILGAPDDLKFHSCMTLFAAVAPDEPLFTAALARFYGGRTDGETLARL